MGDGIPAKRPCGDPNSRGKRGFAGLILKVQREIHPLFVPMGSFPMRLKAVPIQDLGKLELQL